MSGTKTDYKLSTDIYDIERFVDAIKAKYIDIPEDTLTMGIYGYLSEIMSNSLENASIMASEYANEASPTKAKFERNVLSHALSLGIKSIRATPAMMSCFICFPEDIMLKNMKNNEFLVDRNIPIYIGEDDNYEYHIDYDITIKRNFLPNGNYTYTAMYDINDPEKNDVSDISNPYLPAIGLTSIGQTNLVMIPTLIRQVEKNDIYRTVLVNNPLESKTLTFSFDNQLAYFTVTVTEGDKTHYLTPVYDGLTCEDGSEYCNYMYIDASTIRISFNRESYQPRANASIKVSVYTTQGTKCNFTYNTDRILKMDSEKFNYDANLWMLIRPISDSLDGKDRDDVDQIRKKIPKQMLMRGSVTTTTDLNNYFNFLNTDNRRLYFLEKVHNQIERIYYSYLLLKANGDIVPSNTIDVMVNRSMFSNINVTNYVILPGAKFYLEPGMTEATSITTTNETQLKTLDKSGFLYMNPFLTLINKNPFFTQYYLTILDYYKTLNFTYINSKAEVQFIATRLHVLREYFTARDTYKFELVMEQNVAQDFALINLDSSGNIVDCLIKPVLVLYDDGIPIRYMIGDAVAFDEQSYQYTFLFKSKTTDVVNRNNKMELTTGLYMIGTETESSCYLPRNVQAKIYIMAKMDTNYGKDADITNILPGHAGWSLTNIYSVYMGIDLFYDYTDLMTSYTTLYQNENKTFSYIIKKVPCIRQQYLNSEQKVKQFVKLLETNKLYLESALVLLEDSFGIDFKFFNTYGPSKLYNIDEKMLLNKTNLSLTFEVKFVMASDSSLTTQISADIKEYLEDINEINDLHMPNLVTYITNKYRSQLVYFKFIDLNGYGPIRQSMYREDIDEFVEATTVPEFLNVDTILETGEPDIKYNIVS